MKYIRKVVNHVPTGKEWFTRGVEWTKETEEIYRDWIRDTIHPDTVFITLCVREATGEERVFGFNKNILKDCVSSMEIYGVDDE